MESNNYTEDLKLLKSLHSFYKNNTQTEKDDNILIKYLKNKQIINDNKSDSLSSFINELSNQILKGNNIILPFIDPCYDLVEAYINCDNEKEIFMGDKIFEQLIENSFINRKVLLPIYSFFTEIYSEMDKLTETDLILNKFPKIINLWKLFYLLSENKSKKPNSLSSFCFIGSGLILSGLKSLPRDFILNLKINFLDSKFLHYIDKDDDLIKSKVHIIKYSKLFDIQKEEITSIEFIIINQNINIKVNHSSIKLDEWLTVDTEIDTINILNNFYGQIKSMELNLNKRDSKKNEQTLYSKVIVPFPLKNNGTIFKTKIEINKKIFLQNNFQLNDLENLNLCFPISNQNSKVDLKIELNLKIEDEHLIKVNYINYKEEKFSIIDYFGGIVQFLPFLKIINGLYKNIKILDKIGKIDFLIDFSETILLIIFNHLINSSFEKQENFKIYWNFYFYLLNKIELFQDKEIKINISQFSLYKLGNNTTNSKNNKVYFEMFINFLYFVSSKNKNIQNKLKDME